MDWLSPISFFKLIGPPGSLRFLAVGLVVTIALAKLLPHSRIGVRAAVVLIGSYLLMSLPVTASALMQTLPIEKSARTEELQNLDLLIVVDGDNRLGRVLTLVRLAKTSNPAQILMVNAPQMRLDLQIAHFPLNRVNEDNSSWNTRSQAEVVARWAGRYGRVAVIASRLQAPRLAGALRALNVHPLLVVSDVDAAQDTNLSASFLPSLGALFVSRDAIYERAALWYYQLRGWTS